MDDVDQLIKEHEEQQYKVKAASMAAESAVLGMEGDGPVYVSYRLTDGYAYTLTLERERFDADTS